MKKIIIVLFSVFLFTGAYAQEENKKLTIDGYVSFMQTVMTKLPAGMLALPATSSSALPATILDSVWMHQNMFHNRLNFNYYPNEKLKVNFEIRNRLIYGDMITIQQILTNKGYGDNFEKENRSLDMSWNLVNRNSWILNTMIDRAYAEYTLDKLQLSLGRQRINWGRSMVWNPNDIFNSYSFFDFDYVERAGADAFRAVYYTGVSSEAELIAALGDDEKITYAGLYKFNKFNYDWQAFASYTTETEYATGVGFEGYVKDVSVRGEGTYFIAEEDSVKNGYLFSVGADKLFPNDYSAQVEFLYNSYYADFDYSGSNPLALLSETASAKSLSFDEYSIFANVNKQISPLISASVAGMYFVNLKGFFVNPTISISLKENLNLSFVSQYFNYPTGNGHERDDMVIFFGRIKQSF